MSDVLEELGLESEDVPRLERHPSWRRWLWWKWWRLRVWIFRRTGGMV